MLGFKQLGKSRLAAPHTVHSSETKPEVALTVFLYFMSGAGTANQTNSKFCPIDALSNGFSLLILQMCPFWKGEMES